MTTLQGLKRGDAVVFQWGSRWVEGEFLATYPEMRHAVKVRKAESEYIVLDNEVKTVEQRDREKEIERIAKDHAQYRDVVDAWKAGMTMKDLAAAMKCSTLRAVKRHAAAKRRGLVS